MRLDFRCALTSLASLLLVAGCGGSGADIVTPPPPPPSAAVASVSVTGGTSTLTVGGTLQLTATPRDASGTALTGRSVTWTTGAAAVATVTGGGLVSAIAPGSAVITATSEGIAGAETITVSPVAVASVAITAPKVALLVGETSQYTAQPKDAQGNALSGRAVSWSSSAQGVATVSASGLVTAISVGSATITATSETITGNVIVSVALVPVASVVVTAPKVSFVRGDQSQYSALTKDAQGNPLSNRVVTWNSTAPAVASVSNTGLVTALALGTSLITASSEGVTSTATSVTVTLDPALIEQRVLAQQGLAIALASTVLQSQLLTLISLAIQGDDNGCSTMPGGGAFKYLTSSSTMPFQIAFYFDTACARMYMHETVTTFTADDNLGNFHIIATAAYTGPTGTSLGNIAFDEFANSISLSGNQILGTVNGLGIYTSGGTAPSVQLGLNCNLGVGGHNIGVCQGGIAQDFAGLNASYGSVTTLALDSATTGVLTLNGTSQLTSGAIGALTLAQPTATSMVVNGGSAYGNTADVGSAATFSLFPPTPTGWMVTDAVHDQVFTINVADNTVRNLIGTLKRISTGATLATIALDQSGTGTITYSDNTVAAITSWMLSQ